MPGVGPTRVEERGLRLRGIVCGGLGWPEGAAVALQSYSGPSTAFISVAMACNLQTMEEPPGRTKQDFWRKKRSYPTAVCSAWASNTRAVGVHFRCSSESNSTPATGAPAITGTAQVGETLTADTSGIADPDGLDNTTFSYQWLADGTAVQGATGSSYTISDDNAGNAIRVRVSFTAAAGNEWSLTSAATVVVRAPLTVSLENEPSSHDGKNVFTFELRFSDEVNLSFSILRDHAFTVDGGEVKNAKRLTKGSNIRWEITIRPDGAGEVTITLTVTEDCGTEGAICMGDGRMLSNRLVFTVSGPGPIGGTTSKTSTHGQVRKAYRRETESPRV